MIETLAEMKTIMYVLRHTWGYQDDEKRISIDEFVNGRKHSARYRKQHPGEPARIDNGTGMSANAVKDGIKRAIEHGFITVDSDDSDKARIRKYYSLNLGGQKLTPRGSEVDPLPSEVDPRTKKETLERNSGNNHTPSGVVAPVSDQESDVDLFFGGDGPRGEPTPKAKPVTTEKRDVIVDIVTQAARRENPLWFLEPGTPAGDHDYLEPFKAFCAVINRDPSTIGEHKTLQWERRLEKIAIISTGEDGGESLIIAPGVMAQAIKAIRGDWNFEHKRWSSPFCTGFVDLVELTASQITAGTLVGESKDWSQAI